MIWSRYLKFFQKQVSIKSKSFPIWTSLWYGNIETHQGFNELIPLKEFKNIVVLINERKISQINGWGHFVNWIMHLL